MESNFGFFLFESQAKRLIFTCKMTTQGSSFGDLLLGKLVPVLRATNTRD